MSVPWKPVGHSSVSPYVMAERADDLIAFLTATFGAEPARRKERPDGSVEHAEVRIDDTIVMIGEVGAGGDTVPSHVHVYVPDVDAAYARGLAAGGTSVQEPARKDDPDRRAAVQGPGGHTWWIGTQLDDTPWGEAAG